jgi:hypothetical protein
MRCCRRPLGIVITPDIHEELPEDVKEAWEAFDNWWQKNFDGSHHVNLSEMPREVSEAFDKIKNAPIPGYDGLTFESSCYMQGVKAYSFFE